MKRKLELELTSCKKCPYHCVKLKSHDMPITMDGVSFNDLEQEVELHYCWLNEFNQCADSPDANDMLFIGCSLEQVLTP